MPSLSSVLTCDTTLSSNQSTVIGSLLPHLSHSVVIPHLMAIAPVLFDLGPITLSEVSSAADADSVDPLNHLHLVNKGETVGRTTPVEMEIDQIRERIRLDAALINVWQRAPVTVEVLLVS